MRGRVIAGLQGDAKARIFCQDLQAELISVAGHYRVSENIPAELKGKRVQVFLDHEILRIEPM
jgi:septum site-determining protein MinC